MQMTQKLHMLVNNPGWGNTAEGAWQPIAARDYISGCFVWTGFDYKGEPTPYAWPNINSHFGVIDIAGFPKDTFYYYKVNWGNESNQLHVFPHWNWNTGDTIEVWMYSNTDSVELFVNGKSQGKQQMPHIGHTSWKVTYEAGSIEGRAYDTSGKQVASKIIETTGAPSAIKLTLEWGQNGIVADGQEAALVAVSIIDSNGRVVPTASNEVSFTVTGPGKLIGLGSGDPSNHEPDKGTQRKAFNGLVRAVVKSEQQGGVIVLQATTPGLPASSITINTHAMPVY